MTIHSRDDFRSPVAGVTNRAQRGRPSPSSPAKLPVREQLKIHREQAACNDCHRSIDPWGIAMEGFGADGLSRTEIPRRDPEKKGKMFTQPVITETTLPGGTDIDGMDGLKTYLLEEKRGHHGHLKCCVVLWSEVKKSVVL